MTMTERSASHSAAANYSDIMPASVTLTSQKANGEVGTMPMPVLDPNRIVIDRGTSSRIG